jgi:hypothetical protein
MRGGIIFRRDRRRRLRREQSRYRVPCLAIASHVSLSRPMSPGDEGRRFALGLCLGRETQARAARSGHASDAGKRALFFRDQRFAQNAARTYAESHIVTCAQPSSPRPPSRPTSTGGLIPIPAASAVRTTLVNIRRAVVPSARGHSGSAVVIIVVPWVVALSVRRATDAHVEARSLQVNSLRGAGRRGATGHYTNEPERDHRPCDHSHRRSFRVPSLGSS